MKSEKNLHPSVITVLTLTTRDRPEKTITTVSVEKGGGGIGGAISSTSVHPDYCFVMFIISFVSRRKF